jgi:hypothetical protein
MDSGRTPIPISCDLVQHAGLCAEPETAWLAVHLLSASRLPSALCERMQDGSKGRRASAMVSQSSSQASASCAFGGAIVCAGYSQDCSVQGRKKSKPVKVRRLLSRSSKTTSQQSREGREHLATRAGSARNRARKSR